MKSKKNFEEQPSLDKKFDEDTKDALLSKNKATIDKQIDHKKTPRIEKKE